MRLLQTSYHASQLDPLISWLQTIEIIAKVESFDSIPNIVDIVDASDAIMVARGDLGEPVRCPWCTSCALPVHSTLVRAGHIHLLVVRGPG